MTTFKTVLINIRRNFAVISLYAVIFLVISVVSLSNIGDRVSHEYNEVKPTLLISHVEDDSQFSREFLAYLDSAADVTIKQTSKKDVKDLLESGFYDAELSVPKNAEKSFIEGTLQLDAYYISQVDASGGALIMQKVDRYLQFLKAHYNQTGNISNQSTLTALSSKASITMLDKTSHASSKEIWYGYFVKFLAYVIIAMFTTLVLIILADFNELAIYHRRFSSRTSMFKQSISLAAGIMLCLLAIIFVLLTIGLVMIGFDIPIRHIVVSIGSIIVFSITIVSLTVMIASFGIKKNMIGGLCNVLALGMSFLTGIFVPLEFLPSYVVKIAHFLPSYYYVKLSANLDGNISFVAVNLGVMLLFALCFITVTWFVGNRKKQLSV